MDADNPWQVDSIEAFYFLKVSKSQKQFFLKHPLPQKSPKYLASKMGQIKKQNKWRHFVILNTPQLYSILYNLCYFLFDSF